MYVRMYVLATILIFISYIMYTRFYANGGRFFIFIIFSFGVDDRNDIYDYTADILTSTINIYAIVVLVVCVGVSARNVSLGTAVVASVNVSLASQFQFGQRFLSNFLRFIHSFIPFAFPPHLCTWSSDACAFIHIHRFPL